MTKQLRFDPRKPTSQCIRQLSPTVINKQKVRQAASENSEFYEEIILTWTVAGRCVTDLSTYMFISIIIINQNKRTGVGAGGVVSSTVTYYITRIDLDLRGGRNNI